MLDEFKRTITNIFYFVPLKVNKFKEQHPEANILIADATKARREKANRESQYEVGWVTSRRGVLILTPDRLYCGDWIIPLSNVQEATLLQISGGSLLKVSTTDGIYYQFGLQRNPAWEEQKVLPINVHKGILKLSKTGFVLQLLILVWLAYTIVQDYQRHGLNWIVILYLIVFVWFSIPLIRLLKFPKGQ